MGEDSAQGSVAAVSVPAKTRTNWCLVFNKNTGGSCWILDKTLSLHRTERYRHTDGNVSAFM